MIQTQSEMFSAMDAVNAGLIDAIKNGETRLECHVEINRGELIFDQRTFTFTDKDGNLRSGKFKDDSELVAFYTLFYPDDEDETV